MPQNPIDLFQNDSAIIGGSVDNVHVDGSQQLDEYARGVITIGARFSGCFEKGYYTATLPMTVILRDKAQGSTLFSNYTETTTEVQVTFTVD